MINFTGAYPRKKQLRQGNRTARRQGKCVQNGHENRAFCRPKGGFLPEKWRVRLFALIISNNY
jgi:hypothetical protein